MPRRQRRYAEEPAQAAPKVPAPPAPAPHPAPLTGPAAEAARLQRSVGNTATTAVIQRRRRRKKAPSSTTTTPAPAPAPAPAPTPSFSLTSHADRHIFEGEYKRGSLKGYHSRPGGKDFGSNRLVNGTKAAVAKDCYTARWGRTTIPGKTKFSTFFPDSWSRSDVIAAIGEAVADGIAKGTAAAGGYFSGTSKKGVGIQGYLDGSKRPVTAFPKV